MNLEDIPFLTFQQQRILKENIQDMELWQNASLDSVWPTDTDFSDINSVKHAYEKALKNIDQIRKGPIDYSTFNPQYDFSPRKPEIVTDFKAPQTIMGRCPCPDESMFLRCCNLKTLDAIQQCGFACAYCSIQSFYSNNQIRVISDLKEKLNNIKLDPSVWHIGTGQSSDSLLLANDYGTLTALFDFANKNPDLVIELKTKCARTDWLELDVPKNVISTWSVNANTVVQKEEHGAASLDARINAAAKCAEKGHLVGFHIHPMVYFKGWEEQYAELVKKLTDKIDPNMVALIGMGTLTFTKANLKTLRESKRPTRVTQMQFTPIAGKYSYPLEVKQKMFSHVYSQFTQDWKDKVFFYLCMEDPALWQPCLGRKYNSNIDFENDMKKSYTNKIGQLAKICL